MRQRFRMGAEGRSEQAFAKVNLTLHVTGQRPDGYHLLDSLVVFANFGDVVTLGGGAPLTLKGSYSNDLSGDNLVLKAAALMQYHGPLTLEKNLPIAAGLGGGSSDAAATLRLLARVLRQPIPNALALGADVPVCLTSVPQRMTGIGESVCPVDNIPDFWLVLVNPAVAVSTAQIFAKLDSKENPPMIWQHWRNLASFTAFLRQQRNDLQATAVELQPIINTALAAIEQHKGCLLARMSGSGATCFGIFQRQADAEAAANAILAAQPRWWVKAARRL